eukprot:scaffold12861_cov134-Isochrysis_galbana.AAC.4
MAGLDGWAKVLQSPIDSVTSSPTSQLVSPASQAPQPRAAAQLEIAHVVVQGVAACHSRGQRGFTQAAVARHK